MTGKAQAVVNIAAYKFVPLVDLESRRKSLRWVCKQQGLKGTILLSPEGINLFLAGSRQAVDVLLAELRSDAALADLEIKESLSDRQPFRRMLVKIKQEIITFRIPDVDPRHTPAPRISPEQLKQWLDEGRAVVLLDVRNDYEVQLGAFQQAKAIGTSHFRQFPAAVRNLPDELKQQPVITYCTGGIRCEKAAPYLKQAGFKQVYQLDGGILKYFEHCGDAHWRGECFVFDQRVALNSRLQETTTTQCFACQHPLTAEDQQSPHYLPEQYCPYCYRSSEQQQAAMRHARQTALREMISPLPGSTPYVNRRPLHVPGRYDGLPLLDFLDAFHPHLGRQQWQVYCDAGRLVRRGEPLNAQAVVRAGERIEHLIPNTVEPEVNAAIQWLHEDEALVVVHKPAPLPMHPCGRFNRNTLISLLDPIYRPERLRMTHRLDANTSGVVVLARRRSIARHIQPQFEQGQVAKQYLVRVHGQPKQSAFSCDAAIGPQTLQAGARQIAKDGLAAYTEFECLRMLEDGTSLLLARPQTGRTNQIRLHLAHLQLPVCGDQTYRQAKASGPRQTLTPDEAPLCLHAWRIELQHPLTQQRVTYEAPLPTWAQEVQADAATHSSVPRSGPRPTAGSERA